MRSFALASVLMLAFAASTGAQEIVSVKTAYISSAIAGSGGHTLTPALDIEIKNTLLEPLAGMTLRVEFVKENRNATKEIFTTTMTDVLVPSDSELGPGHSGSFHIRGQRGYIDQGLWVSPPRTVANIYVDGKYAGSVRVSSRTRNKFTNGELSQDPSLLTITAATTQPGS